MSKKRPDPFATRVWRDYARHFHDNVLPQIKGSANCIAIVPKGDGFDVKFALELGAMIMLDKPVVLLVPSERAIPPRMARVADKIIVCDLSTEAGQKAAQQQLAEYLNQ